ncbi:Proline dehydrogenase 1, mitochondrial [Lamellibrachia satsuma]|nr:Proline dehydrogenase 1, mitochondrial [Lamellibrachia satsuma]
MKRTIYGQFLAGENDAEILAVAERNQRRGVNAMMAYIARETHGAGGERRGKCPRRPTLDIYQTNFDAVRHSIDLAADVTSKTGTNERQLAAAKLTFLVSTEILRHLSDLVTKNTSIVSNAYRQSSAKPVKMKALVELLNDICRQARQCSYDFLIPPATSNMEQLDASLTTNIAFHLTCSKTRDLSQFTDGELSPVTLSSSEEIQTESSVEADYAESCGVVFVWDAEQTYLQPAIDLFVFDLMRRYNRRRAVVFHTYQCYLKSTYEKIIRDLELSRKEDFCLAAKLVRGAYLKEERHLAASLQHEDPTNPTYESTAAMYNRVVDEFLRHVQTRPGGVEVMFASHNEATVGHVLRRMTDFNLHSSNGLSFAQLHGMRDYITMPLGHAGYPVYKMLNYGPVEECVAFLSRRAQENSSAISTACEERKLISRELRRRFNGLFAAAMPTFMRTKALGLASLMSQVLKLQADKQDDSGSVDLFGRE